MKQETLEEAAERMAKEHCSIRVNLNTTEFQVQQLIIKGAKEQAKRMYSEKDLKEAFKVNYTPFSATNIGDFDKDWDKWFEQFKKKKAL
jgi:hypothetical protein